MIMKGVDEHTTDIFCHRSLEALIENKRKKAGDTDSENKKVGKLNELSQLPNSVELCKECHNEKCSGDKGTMTIGERTTKEGEHTIVKGTGKCDIDETHTVTSHTVKNALCLLDPATLEFCFATEKEFHDTPLQPLSWQRGQVQDRPTFIDGTLMKANEVRCEEMGQPRRQGGISEYACKPIDHTRHYRWNQKHLDVDKK